MTSIKDVAELAGVSSATVSRVLSNKQHVSETTRERVLKAIEALGYQPSRVARSLRVKSSQIIGLIISDIQNPFFTGLVRAVEDVAYQNNYAIFLCNTDEDPNKESLYVDLMISERVAGVIVTPAREIDGACRRLIDRTIPAVSVDRRVLDCSIDTVVLDNAKGAYGLVNHLVDNKHRRIGAILGSSQITTGRERLEGYKQVLLENGISFDGRLVRQGLPKEELGYRFANELLDLEQPPTAIFSGNNLLAIGVVRAITDRGLSIPGDISLVSFDDQEWTRLIHPRITVAAQPTYEMGRIAAELVMKRITSPNRRIKSILLEPKLIFRESVREVFPYQVVS